MMVVEVADEIIGLFGTGFEQHYFQGPQSLQWAFDRLHALAGRPKQVGLREYAQSLPSATALAWRQLEEAAFSQFGQQQPGRHVFELAIGGAPVELLAHRNRQPIATPVRMGRNQPPNQFYIIAA